MPFPNYIYSNELHVDWTRTKYMKFTPNQYETNDMVSTHCQNTPLYPTSKRCYILKQPKRHGCHILVMVSWLDVTNGVSMPCKWWSSSTSNTIVLKDVVKDIFRTYTLFTSTSFGDRTPFSLPLVMHHSVQRIDQNTIFFTTMVHEKTKLKIIVPN